MESPLILPGDPLFDTTLATAIPPGWRQAADQCGQQVAFVAPPGGSGLLRPATPEELVDYLAGGEYDDRQAELEDKDDEQLVLYGPDIA